MQSSKHINRIPIITLMFFLFPYLVFGQDKNQKEIYKVIKVVINNINPKIPIVDSLHTTVFKNEFHITQIENKISLTSKQKEVLKKGIKNDLGLLIDKNYLKEFNFYNYKDVIKKFQNINHKANFEKISYYLLSKPLFFNNDTIAILNVDLIKGFGAIYILKKEDENWRIIGEIGRWYS